MGLNLSGELLAVTERHVNASPGNYDAYDVTTLSIFDAGRVFEVRTGRDFTISDTQKLRKCAAEGIRPQVQLEVFPGNNGKLFADKLLDLLVPETV